MTSKKNEIGQHVELASKKNDEIGQHVELASKKKEREVNTLSWPARKNYTRSKAANV